MNDLSKKAYKTLEFDKKMYYTIDNHIVNTM